MGWFVQAVGNFLAGGKQTSAGGRNLRSQADCGRFNVF